MEKMETTFNIYHFKNEEPNVLFVMLLSCHLYNMLTYSVVIATTCASSYAGVLKEGVLEVFKRWVYWRCIRGGCIGGV